MKIYWKVQRKPQGPYRSFDRRGWPSASNEHGNALFRITCDVPYRPAQVKTGNHPPLRLWFADWRIADPAKDGAFKWRCLKQSFATLDELKIAARGITLKYPEIFKGANR